MSDDEAADEMTALAYPHALLFSSTTVKALNRMLEDSTKESGGVAVASAWLASSTLMDCMIDMVQMVIAVVVVDQSIPMPADPRNWAIDGATILLKWAKEGRAPEKSTLADLIRAIRQPNLN